jgi:predicted transcriptional regulator
MPLEVIKIENPQKNLDPYLLHQHRTVVIESEDLYPGIDIWYDKRAKPGIERGERIGYLVKKDGIPAGAAIAKQGHDAKICTVRVKSEAVHEGIGKILFLLIAMNLRRAREVHFTAPEELWEAYRDFFNEMCFKFEGYSEQQYRIFGDEIVARADFTSFYKAVIRNYLPRYASHLARIGDSKIDLILSVKPEFAKRITNKTKVMELRRKFSRKWIGKYALVYSSSPVQALVAKVKIKDVVEGTPISIWHHWNKAIDCREDEFRQYTKDAIRVYGIILDEVEEINQVPKTVLEHLLQLDLIPPQSHCEIHDSSLWQSAIGLSYMLQKNI